MENQYIKEIVSKLMSAYKSSKNIKTIEGDIVKPGCVVYFERAYVYCPCEDDGTPGPAPDPPGPDPDPDPDPDPEGLEFTHIKDGDQLYCISGVSDWDPGKPGVYSLNLSGKGATPGAKVRISIVENFGQHKVVYSTEQYEKNPTSDASGVWTFDMNDTLTAVPMRQNSTYCVTAAQYMTNSYVSAAEITVCVRTGQCRYR